MANSKARARVTVTVEIEVPGGSWGRDCTVDQVYAQAAESALGAIRRGLRLNGVGGTGAFAQIIGDPKVVAVIAEEDR